nr:retrovirus-related Pol polyprotein from transposon TNT 1-94 [Tanacetum cinerariifolium]
MSCFHGEGICVDAADGRQEPGSRVVLLSRIDLKGSLLFVFSGWKEQEGDPVWATSNEAAAGDFGLWRVKMRTLLIQHGCKVALEVLPTDMEAQTKAKLNKKAHSAVILCLALTFEDVMATLNSKEIKERSKAKGDDGEGLYVRGRTDLRDSRQSRRKSRLKSRGGRLKCYIFQSEDHLKRNSPKNNRKKSSGFVNKDDQPSSSGLIYDGSEVMMGMSAEALLDWIMDSREALLDWIMDSRGSYHMTPRLDLFFDFLEYDRAGYCWVTIRSARSEVLARTRRDNCVYSLDSHAVVINGSKVVLSRTRRDNYVYSLDSHAVVGELNASVKEKDSLAQVWHKRVGHISEAGLQVLEKQGLFGKKSLGKLNFCENYVLGKSQQVSFGVGRHTTQGVIDYVHSDLWGPSQVESLGGKRYFLSIVDDYSRRVCVYLLRFKHEAFEKFKEWTQLAENQTGRTVKKLRTDNGLEFCNREFKQLCIESGIARHFTVAEMSQQNGLAERMNITLMDKVEVELQRLNNHTLKED